MEAFAAKLKPFKESTGLGDAAQQRREAEQLERGLGHFLKASVAAPAADSSLWGILADFYTLTGFPDSAKEAALKRVRALQGAAWLTDPTRFLALATATLALCQLFVTAASAGNAIKRDLASGRMQLRGLIKPGRQEYEEVPNFSDLQQMLQTIERLEADLL